MELSTRIARPADVDAVAETITPAFHDDHRGHGIGERLLAQNLELIDAEHVPAYLESSNPKNLARYERLGFRPLNDFDFAPGGPTVTTMWRPAR